MTLTTRQCTIAEIEHAPNIAALLAEYAVESSIGGLPHPAAKMDIYRHLESVGAIYPIGAFLDDMLVGFITILSPVNAHYGIRIAVAESFFVAKEYRKTGAGIKLRKAAEAHAKEIGSCGLLISAPIGGYLAEVLPHAGYTETNRVFFRNLSDA